MGRTEIEEAYAGDIVGIAGFADIQIGESICSLADPQPLPLIKVDEPTLQMNFSVMIVHSQAQKVNLLHLVN